MKTLSMLAVAALMTIGAHGAFASTDIAELAAKTVKAPARACIPDPQGNKYSLCYQECRGYHNSGGSNNQERECNDSCVARYCNN